MQTPVDTSNNSYISVICYNESSYEEKKCAKTEDIEAYKNKQGVKWFNVDGTDDQKEIEKIGSYFDLHPLLIEDIVHGNQRPKLEDYDKNLFVVLNMLSFDEVKQDIISEQISIVIGEDYVISFQEAEKLGDVFNPSRDSIRSAKGKIRKQGPDYLLYSLLDTIVDNYFIILEKIGEKLERLEDRLAIDSSPQKLKQLYVLKRDLISLRKSVWPLREVLARLERDECEMIKDSTKIYMRDVYDHTIQVIDGVESFRDTLSSMLDLHISVTSNKMNNIMKVLTVISTIFMPLTFIVGVYGMNFRNMPELQTEYGYFVVMGLCLIISVVMIFYFRAKKWL